MNAIKTSLLFLLALGAAIGCATCDREAIGDFDREAIGDDKKETRSMNDEELRERLTDLQYAVTQQNGTEPPFDNEYWDNKEPGIYVDVVSGVPLFTSLDKYDSGCGWPSFTAPIENKEVVENADTSHRMVRTEVRAAQSDSHLGHVFEDGPAPSGQRYCINSAALRFIHKNKLEQEGYGEYLSLFSVSGETQTATFGAGCFWGVEAAFRKLPGVVDTAVGYLGGATEDPTYQDVCSGRTGHAEVVQVTFDPARVTYEKLLELFWTVHDPTTLNRQGPDVGTQYRSAIFFHSSEQEQAAVKSKRDLVESGRFGREVVTEITEATPFYKAEEYHQRYLEKRGKTSCGL